MQTRTYAFSRRAMVCGLPLCALIACSSDADPGSDVAGSEHVFATSSIVLSDEGETTYVALLASLQQTRIDLKDAHEFSGWSTLWSNGGKVFVSDGEAPTMTRFGVSKAGRLEEEGKVGFLNEGSDIADSTFIDATKAYVFADDAIVWNPTSLEIEKTFELPAIEDRPGGHEYSGARSGRGLGLRDNRAYIATSWGNWDDYTVTEDSAILVIDTDEDRVIDVLPVPCPYLDVASVDDDGTVYFSNWVYSIGQTLLHGKKRACAVRLLPGEDRLDEDWSLTFADVTDGREAGVLRSLGEGKALISVYHDERAEFDDETTPSEVADAPHWRFWVLDLDTREARPLEGIDYHAGGFATRQIDGTHYVLVPNADYASTTVYELDPEGMAKKRWTVSGWSTELVKVR